MNQNMVINNSGLVGIGTTSPYSLLTLYQAGSTAAASPQLVFSASSTVAGLGNFLKNWEMGIDLGDGGKFKIASSSVIGTNDRLVIDGSGNVGIGTTSPYQMLSVAGGVALPGIANGTGTAYLCTTLATGVISTSTDACNPSSVKYKENIADLSYGLAEVLKLRPVSFDYKPELLVYGH